MKSDSIKFYKFKRRLYKHLWLIRPLTYIAVFSLVIFTLYFIAPKLISIIKPVTKTAGSAISLLNPSLTHINSFRDRTNILLLGIGGGDHPGADLTDSLMLISINLESGDTVLISLPRDIWVESLSAKLNSAYHYGEDKQSGSGLILASSAVAEITNQPIHYTVLLDFSGFEAAIDVLGGLNVNIPHSFTDEKYPIPGKEDALPESDRFETISFSSGPQILDGSTALKYVRSRHAEGEEGTDYARAQRQQRIILAFKDQLLQFKTILNFKKIKVLSQIFKNSVKTNIPQDTYPDLVKLLLRLDQQKIRTGIIDQGSDNEDIPPLLYNPPVSLYGQWVLLPVNNNWELIHMHIADIIYQNQSFTE